MAFLDNITSFFTKPIQAAQNAANPNILDKGLALIGNVGSGLGNVYQAAKDFFIPKAMAPGIEPAFGSVIRPPGPVYRVPNETYTERTGISPTTTEQFQKLQYQSFLSNTRPLGGGTMAPQQSGVTPAGSTAVPRAPVGPMPGVAGVSGQSAFQSQPIGNQANISGLSGISGADSPFLSTGFSSAGTAPSIYAGASPTEEPSSRKKKASGAGGVILADAQPSISMAPVPGFSAGNPENIVPLSTMQESVDRTKQALLSGKFSTQDLKNFQTELSGYADYLTQVELSKLPNQGPSVPNDESLLYGSNDPQGDLAKLQRVRVDQKDAIFQRYGIPQDLEAIKQAQARILAEAQAYDETIKGIQNNPDLPSALAARRTKQIEQARDTNLKALQLQYQFLVDSYSVHLGQAKQDLQISDDTRSEQERLRDNSRQLLSLAISSGGVVAWDAAMRQDMARRLGVGIDYINNIQSQVRDSLSAKETLGNATLQQKLLSIENTALRLQNAGFTAANKTQEQIQSRINSAVDQYKANPTGFRERFIDSLVTTYGETNKGYIAEQVYALMPDTVRTIPIESAESLRGFLGVKGFDEAAMERAANDAGVKGSRKEKINTWLRELMGQIAELRDAGLDDNKILSLMNI